MTDQLTLDCCHAPSFATTKRHHMEVVDYIERDEYVATDVRRLIFPTVFKYERRQYREPVIDIRVTHLWTDPETGEQVGMWHWEGGVR